MQEVIKKEFEEHFNIVEKVMESMVEPLEIASKLIVNTLKNGNKILLFGNGGSAADAQHIAAELTNRYKTTRKALPAIALTTDVSAITSISNDYGYEKVFARQIEALASKDDLVIAISTSGTSPNIIEALKVAKQCDCKIIGLSGNNGGNMNNYCDINLVVPSTDTPRIQEMHILFGHIICHIIDNEFS